MSFISYEIAQIIKNTINISIFSYLLISMLASSPKFWYTSIYTNHSPIESTPEDYYESSSYDANQSPLFKSYLPSDRVFALEHR